MLRIFDGSFGYFMLLISMLFILFSVYLHSKMINVQGFTT